MATIIYDYFQLTEEKFEPIAPEVSISDWLSSLPIFCFAYHAHMPSVKIYRRMENRKRIDVAGVNASESLIEKINSYFFDNLFLVV